MSSNDTKGQNKRFRNNSRCRAQRKERSIRTSMIRRGFLEGIRTGGEASCRAGLGEVPAMSTAKMSRWGFEGGLEEHQSGVLVRQGKCPRAYQQEDCYGNRPRVSEGAPLLKHAHPSFLSKSTSHLKAVTGLFLPKTRKGDRELLRIHLATSSH